MADFDWQTFVERVATEIDKTTTTDRNLIKMAAISTIKKYRRTRFFFNEGQGSLTTVDGTATYSAGTGAANYPDDMMAPDVVELTFSGTTNPLRSLSLQEIRHLRYNTSDKGEPYAYSWHRELFDLFPTPNGAYTVTFDYLKDIGTPNYTYDGTNFTFTDEDDAALSDTWTSDWINDGEELIRAGTVAHLWANVYKDREAAGFSRLTEAQALADLSAASQQYTRHTERELHLF